MSQAPLQRIGALLTAIAFVLVSFFALQMVSPARSMDHDSCVFMGRQAATMCPMDGLDHLAKWKQTFAATFSPFVFTVVLVAVIAFAAFSFFSWFRQLARIAQAHGAAIYKKRHRLEKLFDYMVFLFSDGLLNPRVYA